MDKIAHYLDAHGEKSLLRFITCGSVDDGKSTLIGRLLADSKVIFEDQLSSLKAVSAKSGSVGGDEIDYALLMDGLKAEREQGITIDVAYRYFSTPKRTFIIADTPGHEQYTRNMATGASTAELAIILIDARYGVVQQTRRHAFIVSLLGIKHVVVAINKMDIVDYSQDVFRNIRQVFSDFAQQLELPDIRYVPVSALKGTNVTRRAPAATPWYDGAALLEILESMDTTQYGVSRDFRFPVQLVIRPDLDFRGFAGSVVSGVVKVGDAVRVLPSGKRSEVKRIVTADGDLSEAFAPQAVVIELADEIDISSGDMLVHDNNLPRIKDRFEALVVWLDEKPLQAGAQYLVRHAGRFVKVRVATILYSVDVNSLEQRECTELPLNGIGRVVLETTLPLFLDTYTNNRATGSFIFVDRLSNVTAGAGLVTESVFIDSESGRGTNDLEALLRDHVARREFHWESGLITQRDRLLRHRHVGKTVLITGEAQQAVQQFGKLLEQHLFRLNLNSYYLGASSLSRGLAADITDTLSEYDAQIRRLGELARIMADAGLIFIFVLPDVDEFAIDRLKLLSKPAELMVVALSETAQSTAQATLTLAHAMRDEAKVAAVLELLIDNRVIPDYCI